MRKTAENFRLIQRIRDLERRTSSLANDIRSKEAIIRLVNCIATRSFESVGEKKSSEKAVEIIQNLTGKEILNLAGRPYTLDDWVADEKRKADAAKEARKKT
jgi:hypothetical protein